MRIIEFDKSNCPKCRGTNIRCNHLLKGEEIQLLLNIVHMDIAECSRKILDYRRLIEYMHDNNKEISDEVHE